MNNITLSDIVELNAIKAFEQALLTGADINGLDGEGWSALHKAARGGYKKMVIFLIEHGASRTIKDASGYTPLFYALAENHHDIVNILQGGHA